jgi:beta-glucosidase
VRLVDPARAGSPPDQWVANFQHGLFNQLIPQALTTGRLAFPAGQGFRSQLMPELKGTLDYMGVNYYSRSRSAFDISKPLTLFGRIFHTPGAEIDNIALNEFYPEGLYRVIKWAQQFKLPLYITENGWGDVDENRRMRALILHLKHMWQAINFNWPVYGYYYWTLVDNFEWERGWEQPFGLYALDQISQTRTPRPTANLYTEVCRTNTLSSEMVERYAPELFGEMFPTRGLGDGG